MDEQLEKHLEVKRRNYREQHAGTAHKMGKSVEFRLAKTLTEMRKILWGYKKKMKKKQSTREADISNASRN